MPKHTSRLSSQTEMIILDQCDSTSSDAKNLYTEGKESPFWLLCRQQRGGYGRRGRDWQMQLGDFAGSLIYTPTTPVSAFGEISFIAGLAVFGALESLCSITAKDTTPNISLKWPNDILINGAKTCGIILELINTKENPALCIGIGVNIVSKPTDVAYPTTCLQDYGFTPDIKTLANTIDEHFHLWIKMWHERGFEPVRNVWCEHAAGIGEKITIRLTEKTLTGTFETIDDKGRLILRAEQKNFTISAGDVFFSG